MAAIAVAAIAVAAIAVAAIAVATWSSRSTHIKMPDAGHYIHFDQPQAVIDATASVLAMLRAK